MFKKFVKNKIVKNYRPDEIKRHIPKKSLGQNFLKSERVLNKMCLVGEVGADDTVLEIGPGKGVLTKKLLEKAGQVIAIEKDDELIKILQEKFSVEIKNKRLILIHDDILDFQLNKLKKYKVIANIPYNITGLLLKKFLADDNQPERMILLVQKEVAERITAKDSKESILSLSVGAYGDPKLIEKVNKKLFSPMPKVDSAILSILNISKNNFNNKEEESTFFKIVKAGFAHKRKLLYRNLSPLFNEKNNLSSLFSSLAIDQNIRAEDLKIEKWLRLSKTLSTDI
jgi:16S rRNA (adenine1518-N6/adenine1519-N6)-dimethyltransferase